MCAYLNRKAMIEGVIRGECLEQRGRNRATKRCLRLDDVLNDLDRAPRQHGRIVCWDAVCWVDLGKQAEWGWAFRARAEGAVYCLS